MDVCNILSKDGYARARQGKRHFRDFRFHPASS